jgi:hypothetical protein
MKMTKQDAINEMFKNTKSGLGVIFQYENKSWGWSAWNADTEKEIRDQLKLGEIGNAKINLNHYTEFTVYNAQYVNLSATN